MPRHQAETLAQGQKETRVSFEIVEAVSLISTLESRFEDRSAVLPPHHPFEGLPEADLFGLV